MDTNVRSTAITFSSEMSACKDSSVVVAPSCNSTESPFFYLLYNNQLLQVKNQSGADQKKKTLKGVPLNMLFYHHANTDAINAKQG